MAAKSQALGVWEKKSDSGKRGSVALSSGGELVNTESGVDVNFETGR